MNTKPAIANVVCLLTCCLACYAQTQPATEPPAAAATSVTPTPGATIPLIQFQDVPLITAIENLARQAGLNFIMDPTVPYGQPDATGKVSPQPSITIRWENLTSEQALSALLTVYKLQLVDDPKTKVTTIKVKDPAALEPLITRVIQLKYTSVTNLINAVESTFADRKRSKVVPDIRTSQLVVVATEKELASIDALVDKLDLPTKQVLIEARIMEISRNPSTVKGIDWSGTLKAQQVTFGNNALPGTAPTAPSTIVDANGNIVPVPGTPGTVGGILSDPKFLYDTAKGWAPAMGFLNADGVSAVLSFLNEDADAQVISTPRAVTLDNETAHLSVTRAVPIFKSTAGTQGSPGGSEIIYTNLGTILTVTPRISANDFISLRVTPEVSSIFRTVERLSGGQRNQADEYDIRKIDTQVLIPSGNTLVMGGLMADATKNIYNKVPLLGDIPWLGLLFRHENKAQDKRNLIIFVTPTIVKDSDYQTSDGGAFLKTRPTDIHSAIDTSKAWESARPHDWSNPQATPFDENGFVEKTVEPKKSTANP